METAFPLLGQPWRMDLHRKRYSFVLSDNPISLPHRHRHFELGYLVSGEIEHHFHGSTTHLVAGDYFFVDYDIEHSYEGTADTKVLNFMFYPEAIDLSFAGCKSLARIANSPFFQFTSEKLPLLTRPCFHDPNRKLLQILENLQEEINQCQPGHHQMIRAMIQQIVIHLMRADNHTSQLADENTVIQKVVRYIDEHYADDITIKDIADSVGYSSVHISRLFKAKLNISFTEYLQRYRLGQSCRYLVQTDWCIAKVAEAVGYQNVQFYHRLFRRYYPITPLKYRKDRQKV